MKFKTLRALFIITDWITACMAWSLFFTFRKLMVEKADVNFNTSFYLGICIVPTLFLTIYYVQGTYSDFRRIYSIKVLAQTLFATIIGSLSLFFVLLLDDKVITYGDYYRLLLGLAGIHFLLTFVPRFIITRIQVKRVHQGKEIFPTLLIGGSEKAISIYNEIRSSARNTHTFVGFVNLNGIDKVLEQNLPFLGHVDELEEVLSKHHVQDVIIALDTTEHERLQKLVARLNYRNIRILISPDMYDISSGLVKSSNLFGALLMELNPEVMPHWQQVIKRGIDVFCSILAIICLIPVYLILALLVKFSSKGPILFTQERIGIDAKSFKIIKFRTMFTGAEKAGPQLSSSHDPRITKIGRIMRKLRLDELPQFFNVLKGDMSLVGPRPERQFYIDQISVQEPQFLELTRVRPGITSWGQVKFGYAENVEQMIQRMKFDLLYLHNRSLALDFKIMLHTVLIVIKAKGK